MQVLFRVFLLFCSRDFIRFYAEKQRQGMIDPEVARGYFFRFLGWLMLYLLPVICIIYAYWQPYMKVRTLTFDLIFGGFLLGWYLLFAILRKRQLERMVFAYSDAHLIEARLFRQFISRLLFRTDHYEYTVAGKILKASHRYHLIFARRERQIGDVDPFVYAQSAPGFAYLYEPKKFKSRCLIKDQLAPGKAPDWDLDGRAEQAEKSMIYPQ
ncbi:hypothetical protein O4H49_03145 [Kiloniella laminariae]|uniref:DUF304 domain-containing protein n=1 Tax=Kiloniella laminariae TaxID=454162 RepID=A0ABT4LFA1_9PROT|nr:hypothetical protein [Kiloniella laminariae]MCZ4279759.1 hypothetical protein [Kiloniella laminariae]